MLLLHSTAFDYFKKFNDTFGHHKGDALLMDFVSYVHSIIRPEDTLIRYGGDEFILNFPNYSENQCKIKMNTFQHYISNNYKFIYLSYGVSQYNGSVEETIKSADALMYNMKKMHKVNR